jgi:thiol-disulfide isomerase/thioredoxin
MKVIFTSILLLIASMSFAQKGYEIKVTLKPFKNEFIYLGNYNGKQLPVVDSVKVNDKSEAVFTGKENLGGGIYLIAYPDRAHNFEFLIDKNQHFSIVADTAHLEKRQFINSPENISFKEYGETMMKIGKEMDKLIAGKKPGMAANDSVKLVKEIDELNKKIRDYRNDLIKREPNSLLTVLLNGMKEPELPQDDPAAKKDSLFAYHYYKAHYWDGVNFFDDRLTRTPFFESRIDKYFDQLVYPAADSVIKEMDYMLGYSTANAEMQKFLLLKFINRYYTQKYMWEDAVFVHLFEKYFSQKDYPWMSEKGKKLITDRAYSLMANIMGNPAPEVELPDTTGKKRTLYSLQAPYVLLTIWDPTCGHCKETLPKLDSFYRAKWQAVGLKMFAVAKETEGKKSDWTSFIQDHKIGDWINVYDSKETEQSRVAANIPSYSQLFDVQSFPTLYLLDKDKRIIAKKLTYQQVDEILQQRLKTNK